MSGKLSRHILVRVLSVIILISSNDAMASTNAAIRVCLDESEWYPFTLVRNGRAAGVHIEIVRRALERLDFTAKFLPMPWKRCLEEARKGNVDAVATASYNEDRAVYLDYPAGAESDHKSDLRVMQVEYVVVTIKEDDYRFDNNIKGIPRPVRAPRGYSVVKDLRKLGIAVDDNAASDEINIKKLLRERRGSVIVIPEMVRKLNQQPLYKNKLRISRHPWKSKSYFLPFSQKSSVSSEIIKRIWEEIKLVRSDVEFMSQETHKFNIGQ